MNIKKISLALSLAVSTAITSHAIASISSEKEEMQCKKLHFYKVENTKSSSCIYLLGSDHSMNLACFSEKVVNTLVSSNQLYTEILLDEPIDAKNLNAQIIKELEKRLEPKGFFRNKEGVGFLDKFQGQAIENLKGWFGIIKYKIPFQILGEMNKNFQSLGYKDAESFFNCYHPAVFPVLNSLFSQALDPSPFLETENGMDIGLTKKFKTLGKPVKNLETDFDRILIKFDADLNDFLKNMGQPPLYTLDDLEHVCSLFQEQFVEEEKQKISSNDRQKEYMQFLKNYISSLSKNINLTKHMISEATLNKELAEFKLCNENSKKNICKESICIGQEFIVEPIEFILQSEQAIAFFHNKLRESTLEVESSEKDIQAVSIDLEKSQVKLQDIEKDFAELKKSQNELLDLEKDCINNDPTWNAKKEIYKSTFKKQMVKSKLYFDLNCNTKKEIGKATCTKQLAEFKLYMANLMKNSYMESILNLQELLVGPLQFVKQAEPHMDSLQNKLLKCTLEVESAENSFHAESMELRNVQDELQRLEKELANAKQLQQIDLEKSIAEKSTEILNKDYLDGKISQIGLQVAESHDIVSRNKNWLPILLCLLDTNQTSTVVVGAVHLYGSYGLLELLTNSGQIYLTRWNSKTQGFDTL